MRRSICSGSIVVLLFLILLLSVQVGANAQMPLQAGSTNTPSRITLKQNRIYYHSSGLYSVRLPAGWDGLITETRKEPESNQQLAEADVLFSNYALSSVIYVSVTRYLTAPLSTFNQLSRYIDGRFVRDFWLNYDSSQEVARRTDGNRLVLDLKLVANGFNYDGKLIVRIEDGWLVLMTLVVPENNSRLLADLEQFILPTLTVYRNAALTPLHWESIQDTKLSYFIKYPDDWLAVSKIEGSSLQATGFIDDHAALMTSQAQQNKIVQTDKDARQWVVDNIGDDAETLTVQEETRTDAKGFVLSYTQTKRVTVPVSGLVVLLNGKNRTLYSLIVKFELKQTDLLDSRYARAPYNIRLFRKALNILPKPHSIALRPVTTVLPTSSAPTYTPTPIPELATLRALKATATAAKREADGLKKTLTAVAPTRTPTRTLTPEPTSTPDDF